jgi:hypothetical protein
VAELAGLKATQDKPASPSGEWQCASLADRYASDTKPPNP